MRCPTLAELPPPPPGKTGWPWTEESEQLPDEMPDDRPRTTDDTPSSIVQHPSSNTWPRISIVTPSYNQGQFIEETIRSVLLQNYPNLEYIIIDGGSTDGSVEIIKKYETWLAYWVSEPDRGQGHALNKGIRRATGDIVLWLNSDDICLPGAFRLVAETFQANPDVQLVTGQAHLIDEQGDIIGNIPSYFTSWEELVTNPGNSVRQISTFFSRTLFDELGLVDESLYIALDTDLMVRFTQFYEPLILDDYLTAFRRQKQAKTYHHFGNQYIESDQTRLKYLYNDKLVSRYHERSANNWLCLSESERLSWRRQVTCILHAIQIHPSIAFTYNFWSALKKIYLRLLPKHTQDRDYGME